MGKKHRLNFPKGITVLHPDHFFSFQGLSQMGQTLYNLEDGAKAGEKKKKHITDEKKKILQVLPF